MGINTLAQLGCACMTIDWVSTDTHAVATQKSQVRSQKYGNVYDPGPSGGTIRLDFYAAHRNLREWILQQWLELSDRKRGYEVVHKPLLIPTSSFLCLEHSSPKYPNGTLP